jgi:hypothetical protein
MLSDVLVLVAFVQMQAKTAIRERIRINLTARVRACTQSIGDMWRHDLCKPCPDTWDPGVVRYEHLGFAERLMLVLTSSTTAG